MNSNLDFDPDKLLENVGKSILGKAVIIATVIHVLVIGLTSFGLYKDWAEYGLHTPSQINSIKQQKQREADDARRQEEVLKKEQAVAAAAAAAASNAVSAKATAPAAGIGKPVSDVSGQKTVKPPEIKPLPPATDISLDEIGL